MKKKSKIHDFGQLGKWSEETLKVQKINVRSGGRFSGRSLRRVPLIETDYEKKNYELELDIKESGNKKAKKLTVIELVEEMMALRRLTKEREDLDKNYDDYRKVMNNLK